MSHASSQQITKLLLDWSNGDESALEKLIPIVYDELRRMARRRMHQERDGHTLDATALVHEAFMRLAKYRDIKWRERAQFFAIAALVMRRILVDHARRDIRFKRGGGAQRVYFETTAIPISPKPTAASDHLDVIALDVALKNLQALYPRKAEVVQMRFFAGMENKEIADVLKVSENTVIRDWNFAEAWLRRQFQT